MRIRRCLKLSSGIVRLTLVLNCIGFSTGITLFNWFSIRLCLELSFRIVLLYQGSVGNSKI